MRLITAIIRPERLGAVKAALLREGIGGLTLTRASGHGGEKDVVQQWRAASVVLAFHEKVKVEAAIKDDLLDPGPELLHDGLDTLLACGLRRSGRLGAGRGPLSR